MASITIRNLNETVKADLRILAAQHGHSMEEEARQILQRALVNSPNGLGSKIVQRFAEVGGVDLDTPARSQPRPSPDFAP
jgi:plasmid stability protein